MREILFKAKSLDSGKWVEGYFVKNKKEQTDLSSCIFTDIDCVFPECFEFEEIDENTLCQYTGMTDKNGNKIWENDILESHYDDLFPDDVTISKVVWDTNRWAVQNAYSLDIEDLDDFVCGYGEVAGNVFDNPELLKGRKHE